MKAFYAYGDAGQEEFEAVDLVAAVAYVNSQITPAMLADGAWAIVRDEATMESIEIGDRP